MPFQRFRKIVVHLLQFSQTQQTNEDNQTHQQRKTRLLKPIDKCIEFK